MYNVKLQIFLGFQNRVSLLYSGKRNKLAINIDNK